MDDKDFTMYECMGQPMKQMMDAWLDGVRDPMTDPKWRRKQRIKKFFRRLVLVLKWASIVSIIGVVVSLIAKILNDK